MGRSQSSKSLQGMPEPDTSEPSARSFLLGTAKRHSPTQTPNHPNLRNVRKESPPDKEKKAKKCKKEKKKSKKKAKKSSSSSSDSSSNVDSCNSEVSEEGFADSSSAFGLSKKEMARGMDVANLLELDPRPMGLVLSAVCPTIIANDIFEMGGELESLLRDKAATAKKKGPKKEHTMKAAGTMWKRRMADLAVHLTGRPASALLLCAAKTLVNCSGVLRNLYKRKFPGGKQAWLQGLAAIMKDAREAASDDLKQHMTQPEPKPEPKPAPARSSGHKARSKKEEEEDEPEPEASDKDEGSPMAAPYADSHSDSEDDNDVFHGEFALPKADASKESTLKKLPSSARATLEKIDREVLDTLPNDLSHHKNLRADLGYWTGCLEKEALTEMHHFKLGLEGSLSAHLGPGKSCFMKMSLRARKLFDSWAVGDRDAVTPPSRCEDIYLSD
ncbi:unnamed protein product [Symbiodinium necroappetens]|uniref:Uncharacterized protein n=1 Tax=Symbiodinium necroappetens TaxID=1628268 RepID=A0A812QZ85_9DINO|nr:unnamed protein product [Symbiodinium necroappetens]